MNNLSKKIASGLAGVFFIFTSLVVPANAAPYPGDPGVGVTPGAYGSYEYSFCYYNNNDDLECFDDVDPQIGIVKVITDNSKLALESPSDNGTTVPYRLTLTNNTNPGVTVNTIYIKDYLPDAVDSISTPQVTGGTASDTGSVSGDTDMTWTGTAGPGETIEIEFTATVAADLAPYVEQFQDNTACASLEEITTGNENVLCNEAAFYVDTISINDEIDLMLNKSIVGDNSFREGDEITFEFIVTNTGDLSVSAFDINENDNVSTRVVWPSEYIEDINGASVNGGTASVNNNVISVSGITLSPGDSVVVTATANIRENIAAVGRNITATNRACVEIADDTNPANDCGTFNTSITIPPVRNPQLGIEKQIVDNNDRTIQTSEGGQTIEYRVTVSNSSNPEQNIDEFFVIDSLPAAIDSISNVNSNIGTATQIGNSPDIQWTANGDTFGREDLVEITFEATLEGNATLEDLYEVGDKNQENIACVRLTQTGRNEACHNDQFTLIDIPVPDELDLELFKGEEDGNTSFEEGETINYEFIVTNNSNASINTFDIDESSWPTQYVNNITSVSVDSGSVSNTGNNITWTAGNNNPLASFGGSVTIIATTTVKTGLNLTETTPAPNRACVVTQENDVNPDNDCHDFAVNILPDGGNRNLDGVIQKVVADDDQSFELGDRTSVSYTVTIANTGDEGTTLSQFTVEDILPESITGITDVELASGSQGGGSVSVNNDIITWSGGNLAVGSEVIINFEGTLDPNYNVPTGGIRNQTNTAILLFNGEEIDRDDATFSISNNPPQSPDLILQKAVDDPDLSVAPGQELTYFFTVSNNGNFEVDSFDINEVDFPGTIIEDLSNWRVVAGDGSVTANGTNNVTWNGGGDTLGQNEFVRIAADSRVRDSANDGDVATNVAEVDVDGDTDPTNDRDDATVVVVDIQPGERSILLEKEIDGPNQATIGQTDSLTYILELTNNGDEDLNPSQANPITITDVWQRDWATPDTGSLTTSSGTASMDSNGTITWYGSFPAGQVVRFTFEADLDLTGANGGEVDENVATATFEELTADDDTLYTIIDPNQDILDLAIEKTANPNEVEVGDTIEYRFDITNTGTLDFNGDFDITETWPTEVGNITSVNTPTGTATIAANNTIEIRDASISVGQVIRITARATALTETPANDPAVNTAVLDNVQDDNNGGDQNEDNNDDDAEVDIDPEGPVEGIGIQKEVVGPNVAYKGETTEMDYMITVANNGDEPITPTQANPIVITDVLPASVTTPLTNVDSNVGTADLQGDGTTIHWYGSTIAPNGQIEVTFTAPLGNLANIPTESVEVNVATATYDGESDDDDAEFTVEEDPSDGTDLHLEKTADRISVNVGDTVRYTFTVTNTRTNDFNGTLTIDESQWPSDIMSDIQSVSPSDAQLNNNSITWTGSIPAGQSIDITATATAENVGRATNIAIVTTDGDENPNNNEDDATIVVTEEPPVEGIIIQKEIIGANVAIKGETTEMRYRVTVGNTGETDITPTEAEPIIITDTLPPVATGTITELNSSYGQTTLNGTTINWFGATVPVNGEVIVTYTVELDTNDLANTPDGDVQVNVATATYDGESDDDDAEFTVEDDNQTGIDLHLQKTVDPEDVSAAIGQTINYTFRITNTRSVDFDGTLTIDESQWPSDILSDIETVSPANAQLSGNTITWTGSIPAQDYIEIRATATAENVGVATNIATVTTDGDENPNNNEDDATVVVTDEEQPGEGISIQKIVLGDSSIERGSDTTVEYEITVGNDTNQNVTEFTIVEETWPDVFDSIDSGSVSASVGSASLDSNGLDINWTGTESDFTPGSNIEITFTGILRNDLTEADEGVHRNEASVTFEGETRRDDAEFTITQPGGNPEQDLAIQKEVDSEDIIVGFGETVNYTFTITNNSSEQFSGSFRIAENWPSDYLNDINSVNEEYGTATLDGNDIVWQGNIAGGAQLKIFVTATAKDVEGQATNIAVLQNEDGTPWEDDVPENDDDDATTTIRDDEDRDPIDEVEKILEGNLQSVAPNQQITFTARFTNNSQQTVSKVTIQENETNFTIDSIVANQGTITGNTPTYTWTGTGEDAIIPGESLIVTIRGTVADAVGETMFNEITFEDARDPEDNPIEDPDPDDNTDITDPVPIEADPIDNVTKTVDGNPGSVRTGDQINFTATVTNRSGQTVTQYTITEQTTNFRIDSITAQSGSISGSGPTYTWTGSLANNQTLTVNVRGTVTGTAGGKGGGSVVNTIIFSKAIGQDGKEITDPDPSDNDATTPPVPIIADQPVTPITGGAIALTAGIMGLASLAGAGYYFYRKRAGFKLNQ